MMTFYDQIERAGNIFDSARKLAKTCDVSYASELELAQTLSVVITTLYVGHAIADALWGICAAVRDAKGDR